MPENAHPSIINLDNTQEYKPRNTIHHPPGTTIAFETKAGPIYHIPLNLLSTTLILDKDIPDFIRHATRNQRARKRFTTPLIWNSRTISSFLGKPDSAFCCCANQKPCIHYLLEKPSFERGHYPLHEIMREHADYQKIPQAFGPFSGHLAPLTISLPKIAYLLLLDAFNGPDALQKMGDPEKFAMSILMTNRILPLTSDGFPITAKP